MCWQGLHALHIFTLWMLASLEIEGDFSVTLEYHLQCNNSLLETKVGFRIDHQLAFSVPCWLFSINWWQINIEWSGYNSDHVYLVKVWFEIWIQSVQLWPQLSSYIPKSLNQIVIFFFANFPLSPVHGLNIESEKVPDWINPQIYKVVQIRKNLKFKHEPWEKSKIFWLWLEENLLQKQWHIRFHNLFD